MRRVLPVILFFCWAISGPCLVSGCGERSGVGGNNNYQNIDVSNTPPGPVDVDILFVIDDSQSMLNEQANLQDQFPALINTLENTTGALPNLHIGVVTTDLGAAYYSTIRFCEEVGGDGGILGKVKSVNLGETCIGAGQRYIVDIEPVNCLIERDEAGGCISHECAQQHCHAAAEGYEALTLAIDAGGCPRCRNYSGTLADTFACLAAVGVEGCGFEQPLEAMYRVMDANATPENRGFLRDSAYLAVVIISDEDDCSAMQPGIIFNPDPAEDRIDSALGYLHSFRCFEFGVTCDESGRDPGPRNNCEPRLADDPDALLHPISRYTGYLEALKDPEMLAVATIGGPYEGSVVVELDGQDRPQVRPTCTDWLGQGAAPGIRLRAFTRHYNDAQEMDRWAYTSVCADDFSRPLEGIAARIAGYMLTGLCPMWPLAGCPNGPAGTACAPCLPSCIVYDIENPSRLEQAKLRLAWCGELCRDGLCTIADMHACNYDQNGRCQCADGLWPTRFNNEEYCAPLYYPDAMADTDVDPALASLIPRQEPSCYGPDCPDGTEGRASGCWYLAGEPRCPYGAVFGMVRAVEPPPRTFPYGSCVLVPNVEESCTDGLDDDEDCLTDADDPDCQR